MKPDAVPHARIVLGFSDVLLPFPFIFCLATRDITMNEKTSTRFLTKTQASNSVAAGSASARDGALLQSLETMRKELIAATNYLEALRVRLYVEFDGGESERLKIVSS